MTNTATPLNTVIMNLLEEGKGRDHIESFLLEKGHDEYHVKQIVGETIQLRNASRRNSGMSLILVGAVICFASFLLTITSSFSHGSFPYVLYGLTTCGILIAFAGFTKVF